ncbi:MAG: SDR family oxidoreductase [Rhizobiales bacterium]|nr:SDR family oxidoreductase [Hyphomicrobiales bacterium]
MADVNGQPVALITGASSGIGERLAYEIAADQYILVLVSDVEGELNRVAGILTSKLNATVVALPVDLTKHDAGEIIEDELRERKLVPDVLVNCAGYGMNGSALEMNINEQIAMIDLNARALTDLTLRFLPYMQNMERGGVINVASLASFMPGPYMSVYYATKAYVLSFSQAIAAELEGSGVTVTAVCPGPTNTGFQARSEMTNTLANKLMPVTSAEQIAAATWAGFKANKKVIIPGATNTMLAEGTRFAPRGIMAAIMRRLLTPRHS